MNIRKKLREALLNEGAHKANKYGTVMVFLDYNKSDWGEMLGVIDDDDLYEPKGETGYGKEDEPHVTILYGLHSDISDEDIEKEIKKIKRPDIELGGVSSFNNDLFDVLKFDVESEDLHILNNKFTKFPHTTSYPDYHPHTTIAYLKKGKAKEYINKLNNVKNISVTPSKIVYSKVNGEKLKYDLE
jgi:2'-5' RNA ligase